MQNQISNIHTHTIYSDGKNSPEEYVKLSIEKGYKSIGFSEHGILPFETKWAMKPEKFDDYIAEIKRLKNGYKDQIEIYCGMEIDFIETINNRIIKLNQIDKLDFTIGSVHFIGFFKNGNIWNIDGSEDLFDLGFEQIFNKQSKDLVENYYATISKMIQLLKPTIVGHIDKIKLHNFDNRYFNEKETYYKKAASMALDEILKAGTIVEFNTRGLYRHKNMQPYPSLWMLKELKKRDIPITINSDCHSTGDLGKEYSLASSLLIEAGYKSIVIFLENKWIEVSI